MLRAFQICNGLGAGNIGDEFMARAFWEYLPESIALDVALFPESTRQHAPYPGRHAYRPVQWEGNENANVTGVPGLLVGDTPVTDAEGLRWPMEVLSRRLRHFHDVKQPVDALGVGVDSHLRSSARRLFREQFLGIRSWTVRSNICKESLMALGVPEWKIAVGADWAWLYRPRKEMSGWAEASWRTLGIDPSAPLLVVNLVNMELRLQPKATAALAAALDEASTQLGFQVAFFCNECREGELFDLEAAVTVSSLMTRPAMVVPNEYFSPDEALALLRCATLTLGQRYHFVVESVLAGVVPVACLRGEKMVTLAKELQIPKVEAGGVIDREAVFAALERALGTRTKLMADLALRRESLAIKALENFAFVRDLPPYAAVNWNKSLAISAGSHRR